MAGKKNGLTYCVAGNRIEDSISALTDALGSLPSVRDPRRKRINACIRALNAEWLKIVTAKLRRKDKTYKVLSDELKASSAELKVAKQAVKDFAKSIKNATRVLDFFQKVIKLISN